MQVLNIYIINIYFWINSYGIHIALLLSLKENLNNNKKKNKNKNISLRAHRILNSFIQYVIIIKVKKYCTEFTVKKFQNNIAHKYCINIEQLIQSCIARKKSTKAWSMISYMSIAKSHDSSKVTWLVTWLHALTNPVWLFTEVHKPPLIIWIYFFYIKRSCQSILNKIHRVSHVSLKMHINSCPKLTF